MRGRECLQLHQQGDCLTSLPPQPQQSHMVEVEGALDGPLAGEGGCRGRGERGGFHGWGCRGPGSSPARADAVA